MIGITTIIIFQDYPSLSKLKDSLKNNGIIPIFAVTANVQDIYKVKPFFPYAKANIYIYLSLIHI